MRLVIIGGVARHAAGSVLAPLPATREAKS